MTDNELLLAMSELLDKKLKPVNERLTKIELSLENNMLPRLQNIEACYMSTFNRYQAGCKQIDAMQTDVNLLKSVVRNHSKKLQSV